VSVWVVVGGQYGSEGKGKISAFIVLREQIDIAVRCGGPNSGHCFVGEDGELKVLRQIPTGYIRPETRLLIPSGGLVNLQVLQRELEVLDLGPDRVGVDHRAMIIEDRDREAEARLGLRERLSSTLCGVGSAVSRRVLRGEDVVLAERAAKEAAWLTPYLVDAAVEINRGIDRSKKILVEGTQGFGLSLYHSDAYPKTTSRDTSAAGCISECGISPLAVTNVVLVLRTFPIRVAGEQAGPMYEEIDWETVRRESGYPHELTEFTTVTGKLRRVGRFDLELVRKAVAINRPTALALNFLDYLSFNNRSVRSDQELTSETLARIAHLESELKTPVRYVGVGPALAETLAMSGSPTAHRWSAVTGPSADSIDINVSLRQ
jgi:adenylosuccinate synthase